MANPNISTHLPIQAVQTISGNQEAIQHYLEAAGQTYKTGTPVMLNGSGNLVAWDGATITRAILGIVSLQGQNLSTAGAGASPLFGSIGFPGGTPTYGSVPNQSAAVNLLHGSVFVDGTNIVAQAVTDTIFAAQVDASGGSTFNATAANIGQQFGLTVDTNGFWYVDLNKTTVGTNTVLTIVSLDPLWLSGSSTTTQVNNGVVRFRFLPSATALGV